MDQEPRVEPFDAVMIPADDKTPVFASHFAVHSERELRRELRQHLGASGITVGQEEEMRESLRAQVNDRLKQHSEKDKVANSSPQVSNSLLDAAAHASSGFEIVPVTMPRPSNDFIARSLYVDDRGAFKRLPQNTRASRLAQREIRGDCLLLSNHDDPALETWERVSTSLEAYQKLVENPEGSAAFDRDSTNDVPGALQTAACSKVVKPEDVIKARGLKAKGNDALEVPMTPDARAAVLHYTNAMECLRGRRDFLPDELRSEADELEVTLQLNRALAHMRLAAWHNAAKDARKVLEKEPCNAKALYRLAYANLEMREFDDVRKLLPGATACGVPKHDVAELASRLVREEHRQRQLERTRFSRMFDR